MVDKDPASNEPTGPASPPRYGERVDGPSPRYGERADQPTGAAAAPQATPGQPYGIDPIGQQQYTQIRPGQSYGAGQPGWQAPGPAGQPGPAKTNTLAIIALIVSIVVSNLIGLILGIIALNQIKRTGEGGRGLAVAAIVIGAVLTVIGLIVAIWFLQNGADIFSDLLKETTSASTAGTPA